VSKQKKGSVMLNERSMKCPHCLSDVSVNISVEDSEYASDTELHEFCTCHFCKKQFRLIWQLQEIALLIEDE
jgi:uncharacterized protein with PIN domain